MKSLKTFEGLVTALEGLNTTKFHDKDNGTHGLETEVFVWGIDAPMDKKMLEIKQKLFKMQLEGKPAVLMAPLLEDLGKFKSDAEEATIVFRLVTPLARLEGTMEYQNGETLKHYVMEKIEYIYCKRKFVELDVLEFDKTSKYGVDRQGTKVKVIKLKLTNCIIEPEPPKHNWKGEVTMPPRANVQIISKRTMQSLGKMSAYAKQNAQRLRGVFSDSELGLGE